jgi:small subunit ribosomal protein S7
MPRKGPVAKRDVLPDPLYNSKLVSRLINKMMIDGKRGKSQAILYGAFELIQERSGKEPMEVFEAALKNIMPVLEVRARRVGGSNYQVPVEVRPERRTNLGLLCLVNYARLRVEKNMEERLSNEILDDYNN